MSKRQLPIKAIFFVGLILGAGVVLGVTFADGDAGSVSDGVPYGAPGGMNATIEGSTNVIMETDVLIQDSQTVAMETEAGNITFSSSGPAWATVRTDNITGTYTNVTDIDATANDVTINPEDKRSITVGKDIDRIEFRNAGIDNGQIDFVYAGSSGESKVVVRGLSPDTSIRAVDKTHGGVLDTTTTDSNGVATFTNLSNSEHAVSLETSEGGPSLSNLQDDGSTRYENQTLSVDVDDPDYPDDTVTLEWYVDGALEETTTADTAGTYSVTVGPYADGDHDYYVEATDADGLTDTSTTNTFTIDHHDPVITDIQPSGDLDSEPSQISAQVNDTDFSKDGDSLTVDIILDGSTVDTQTISSNSTVSTAMPSSGQTGGSHNIQIEATDDYGQTTSEATSYAVPDTLFVRNETNASQLVPADGQIRIYGETEIYNRTASDGTLDLDNLPVNQDFIVEIEPTDGNYTTRTVYIESIYEQNTAYVLNTSAYTTIESRFVLEDPTGQYGSETVLKIKRGITINGTTTYQTIVADEFGTEGVTATLQEGERYELSVTGETQSQAVGPYRAATSETVAVEPGQPTIDLQQVDAGYGYGASINDIDDSENSTLEYAYSDPREITDKITVFIHERNNKSNKLQPNETAFNLGVYSGQTLLDTNESETEWQVDFVVERGGETIVLSNVNSNTKDLTLPIDSGWQATIGIGMLILFAGAFSVLNARIGAVILSMVGGIMWWIGWLGGIATGATVTIAILIATISYMYSGGR
jgi:hypothetical protein